MAKRHFDNWLKAFVEYASFGEAPIRMYFWTGVSTLAGALQRKVWIDQAYFKWYPNFYVILVAPPGIVSKSTTASIGMRLLRRVPGVKFGPDVVTWPALVEAFAEATEGVEFENGDILASSPLTLESSELGNLLNPADREMVDLLVSLWDGRDVFEKKTKFSGTDLIEGPWINLIACTTPAWIAGNFPEYMVGGGFTSRCVFVYAEEKRQYVAYPGLQVPKDLKALEEKLVEDLVHIHQNLKGEYRLSPDAVRWGEEWYHAHYKAKPAHLDDERFGGYLARKQSHIHKLAMVLSAAERDNLVITTEDLAVADTMTTDLEAEMAMVFGKIGRSEASNSAEQLLNFIKRYGKVPYADAYRHVHRHFPSAREYEDVLQGLIRSGLILMKQSGTEMFLEYKEPKK